MIEQHHLLQRVSQLVDLGVLRTTLGEHFGTINAANLRRAHALLESGRPKARSCWKASELDSLHARSLRPRRPAICSSFMPSRRCNSARCARRAAAAGCGTPLAKRTAAAGWPPAAHGRPADAAYRRSARDAAPAGRRTPARVVDRPAGHTGLLQRTDPFGRGAEHRDRRISGISSARWATRAIGGEAGIGRPLGTSSHLAELAELTVVANGEDDVAVGSGKS